MDKKAIIEKLCVEAKEGSRIAGNISGNEKIRILRKISSSLRERAGFILSENKKDLAVAKEQGVTSAFYDRLTLDEKRLEAIAGSVDEIAMLEDPIGRIEKIVTRPSGIRVGQMRVPVGVIAVIFESRPNVITDIAALCIKSGNASILRGGKESIHSNRALYQVIADSLKECGYSSDIVKFVDDTDRELVNLLLKMSKHIDIVIPRGGRGLIDMVTNESTIPVIKHDKGVCHTFVDASAEKDMAERICINAKVQRPGVCNAMETLLIHRDYPYASELLQALLDKSVELRGCARTKALMPDKIKEASDADWDEEYLELILSVKIVDSLEEAEDHIYRYSSGHSEAIVTNDHRNAERFVKEVDSAAVMINASTRFHDGGEFGLGAEVGISTQKLHARGAMGIEGLTCLKYVVYGSGEVRS